MKKFLILTSVLIISAGVYFFQTTSAEEKNFSKVINMSVPYTDEQQLKDLYHEMWQALLTKDISTLEKIHADNFVLVHMTGMNQPKAEYLRCIRDGILNYFSEVTENIFIEVNGNKGKLTGQSRVNAAVFGGGRNTWNLQLSFDVEKINGKWILTFAKASTY